MRYPHLPGYYCRVRERECHAEIELATLDDGALATVGRIAEAASCGYSSRKAEERQVSDQATARDMVKRIAKSKAFRGPHLP